MFDASNMKQEKSQSMKVPLKDELNVGRERIKERTLNGNNGLYSVLITRTRVIGGRRVSIVDVSPIGWKKVTTVDLHPRFDSLKYCPGELNMNSVSSVIKRVCLAKTAGRPAIKYRIQLIDDSLVEGSVEFMEKRLMASRKSHMTITSHLAPGDHCLRPSNSDHLAGNGTRDLLVTGPATTTTPQEVDRSQISRGKMSYSRADLVLNSASDCGITGKQSTANVTLPEIPLSLTGKQSTANVTLQEISLLLTRKLSTAEVTPGGFF
ncbi:unnamed protein product [Bemisia tabaci]|uniref:Uncharacterized protein n=1 Tax=Bemisia tabaci TaxID=7038 RepID=A0A9P0AH49_BEMTA|nr:unnamed protein product [Bemisia tabaci]